MANKTNNSVKVHNIIYSILINKQYLLILLAVLTIAFGTWGFYEKNTHPVIGIINSIKMFGLDLPSQWNEMNWQIMISIILAILTITFIATMLFIKDNYNKYRIKSILNNDHIAVFGLGEASISFLNSYSLMKGKEDIAIIEADPDNKKLEEFRKNGHGVFIGDSFSDKALHMLNLNKMRYALIAMGSDRRNIELAKKIYNKYKEKGVTTEIRLIIHIQNRDLDILFHQNFLSSVSVSAKKLSNGGDNTSNKNRKEDLSGEKDKKKNDKESGGSNNLKLDVKTFSFFNEAAEELFDTHNIDGESCKYINSSEGFNTILIGNGELVKSVIYQMALISHLPNQNKHTVHIVDKNAKELLIEIKKFLYYETDDSEKPKNIKNFIIKAVEIDRKSLEYFSDSIWNQKDLVNVIIAYDNEAENLDLAIELLNRTYLSKINVVNKEESMPKIIFAVFDQKLISETINNNNDKAFKHLYTFGNSENVLNYNNLFEEEKYLVARLIHYEYKGKTSPDNKNKDDKQKPENKKSLSCFTERFIKRIRYVFCNPVIIEDPIKTKWFNSAEYSDKLSSIAQAKHIDVKLKTMGFKKEDVLEDVKKWNRELSKKKDKTAKEKEIDKIWKILNKQEPGTCENDKKRSESIREILLEENNKKIFGFFEEYRKTLKIGNMGLTEYLEKSDGLISESGEVRYFPKTYDTLFDKMIRMEHNRWNAFHFLNGWKYAEVKEKEIKEHNCLMPLENFTEIEMQKTAIYDIYSFLRLPIYLAEVGCAIVSIKNDAQSS